MPNYRRAVAPGGTFFFTVNTYRRQPVLIHPAVLSALRRAVRETRVCAGLPLARTSNTASRAKRREGTLWQRRFWEHQIRNENDLLHHVEYIHYNPVKHGHVARVRAWPYSTFHAYVRAEAYPADWGDAGFTDAAGEYGE